MSPAADRVPLSGLHALDVPELDGGPDLEGIVALAVHVTGAPLAVINLLDEQRQVQAAASGDGAGPAEVSRAESLCRHAVEQAAAVHSPDASADGRFRDSPFVDGRYARARMYAAAPLLDADGTAFGTLCVVDTEPRTLSAEQLLALELLADQVVALFESRRRAAQLSAAVAELDRLAHVDGLTGLVNRAAAGRALDRVCRSGGWALLFLDVDGLKAVNDADGHDAGDVLLREVAGRLRRGLRPHDLLARWAGDEFVALLADVADQAAVAEVVARLQECVEQPLALAGRELVPSISAGGVPVPAGSDPRQVLHDADQAMYEVKRRRRERRPG